MPISYKNKIYTTLGTAEKVESDAVAVVTNSSGVPARNYSILGKSIVWNQILDKSKYPETTTTNGITFTNNGDGTITVNGTATQDVWFNIILETTPSLQIDHKGLLIGCPSDGGVSRYLMRLSNSNDDIGNGKIFSVNLENLILRIFIKSGYTATNLKFVPQLFDLTKMFGAGNEPATPEEFRAMFPDDYYPYNAGELKSIMPEAVEASRVERFQLLDKSKYPATATISGVTFTNNGDGTITANGTASSSDSAYCNLRNTKKVPVGHKILISGGVTGASWSSYMLYDASDPLYGIDSPGGGRIYIIRTSAVNPYIFIAKGYTVSNLVFEPQLFDLTEMFGAGNEPATVAEFWQRVPEKLYSYNPDAYKRVNIPSSKYFPDGMRSAGGARDEIQNDEVIKRIGSVDLGTLNWTYSGAGDNRYFVTMGISDIKKISGSSEIPGLLNAIYPAVAQTTWYLNKPCMFKIHGDTPAFCISDPAYTDAATFKAAMSGVMLYYELDTPISIAISLPLQSLPTYRGFNSFSIPNTLTQNGPLSVTYYAEGGANPESGWLTSYKRKLYMGRTIEWNQLFTNSVTSSNGVTISQNQDGTMTLNGTANRSYINFTNLSDAMNQVHKYLLCLKILNNSDNVLLYYGWLNRYEMRTDSISNGESCTICNQTETLTQGEKGNGLSGFATGTVFNNIKIAVMVMDLTQMFGAGNEPATPAEFWSYFDHKLYPYNAGETQPLFKISRKSQWGGGL